MTDDWKRYYELTGTRPPRATLIFALDRFDADGHSGGFAVDLGSGNGRDTIELLRRSWRVLAIDAEESALEGLRTRPDLPEDALLETLHARFEDASWPDADLVNSSFALPLCPPERFDALWARIVASLTQGGRIACQLYGDRDSWVGDKTITFHTREEIDARLAGLDVEYLVEEEDDSVTPRGRKKHWHIFHIVARRPAS